MITLIAAVAKNGVIGNGNAIPWHLPEDFKHFSSTTREHTVIMGSRTWDSLPDKFKPLPKRHNIILSRDKMRCFNENLSHLPRDITQPYSHLRWFSGIDDALEFVQLLQSPEEIFVIGGAAIYDEFIDMADRLIISEVDMEPEGDTYFPKIGDGWIVASRDSRDGFTIVIYERG